MIAPPGHQKKPEVDDRVLAQRAAKGDERAFEELVALYQRDLYRLAYRFVQNADEAHDLCQEAFLKAYLSLQSFRGASSFKTWIYRITMNLSINYVRSAAVSRMSDVPAEELDPAKSGKILSSILNTEMSDRLSEAIDCLPAKQRQVLIFKVYHDLKHREIAELLGCSVGTSKANFFHAVKSLKGIMA